MNSIAIDIEQNELIITIKPLAAGVLPAASILNNTGELIEKLKLGYGRNKILLTPYHSKNYSIRVTNGKNTIVKKI